MIKQQLQLKLSQKLSPQQIKLMKLIQLSTLDLEQKIESELGENPALDNGLEERTDDDDQHDDGYNETEKISSEDIDFDPYLSDDEIPSYRLYANNQSADDDEKG